MNEHRTVQRMVGGLAVALVVLAEFSGAAVLRAQEPSPEAPPKARDYAPQAAARKAGKPWLGVGLETRQECRADRPDECRVVVVVSSVVVDSPAEAAGIEVGDIVVSLEAATPESREFRAHLDGLETGKPVAIEVSRAGEPVAIEVIPEPRPPKPVHVKARPNVAWQWVGPSGEVKVPIVIAGDDSPEGAAWRFEGGENGEGYVVVVPSEEGWRVQVLGADEEAQEVLQESMRKLSVELRDLEQHMEDVEAEVAREQARYWGRVKAELGPEMAVLRDSVLAEARAKLAEVQKARQAYRADRARMRYVPPAHLVEASRRLAGAEFEPLGPELQHAGLDQGLLVLRVIPGTPAAKLGLRRGDVVVEVGESACKSVSDLRAALVEPRGEAVPVKWIRKGKTMTGSLND